MKKAKLLWVDLEMTGLDPTKDRILELAAIASGWDLTPVAELTAVVKVPETLMKRRMVGEFWEKNAESREALMAQNAQGIHRPVWRFVQTKDIDRLLRIVGSFRP